MLTYGLKSVAAKATTAATVPMPLYCYTLSSWTYFIPSGEKSDFIVVCPTEREKRYEVSASKSWFLNVLACI